MNILNYIEHKDVSMLKAINISLRCKVLDVIMPLCTCLASKFFLFVFCIFAEFNTDRYIHLLGIKCIISLTLSTVLSQIIKKSISRLRPFLLINGLNIKKIGIDKYSFPSGHTTAAFAVAVMISLFYPILSFVLSLACLVGISRIYLGVHYPTDVLAGMILGALTSFLIYYLTNFY